MTLKRRTFPHVAYGFLRFPPLFRTKVRGKILNHLFFESRDPPMAGNPLVKFFPPVPERDHATPPRPPCEKFRDAHARKPVFSGGGAWQSYSVAERGIANGFGTFGTRKIDWTGR
jgi:hypothetical protein